jgi:hypothetical protein
MCVRCEGRSVEAVDETIGVGKYQVRSDSLRQSLLVFHYPRYCQGLVPTEFLSLAQWKRFLYEASRTFLRLAPHSLSGGLIQRLFEGDSALFYGVPDQPFHIGI